MPIKSSCKSNQTKVKLSIQGYKSGSSRKVEWPMLM